jgi:DNA (cytosine-5)-methyltransferase 1
VTAWYNECDPYAAQWLRNLIAAGHITSGVVDERDIREVEAFELMEFTQCHFFAGIGVWSKALRDAGWPDDRPIWTGSCPCQPFSAAGKQKGFDDERHLWPIWFDLIAQCRPPVVIGEQVASTGSWLDLVSADLEGAGYAFGASDLCAAGFGGAHIRQRYYFVGLADSDGGGQSGEGRSSETQEQRITERSGVGRLADSSIESGKRNTGAISGTQTEIGSQDRAQHGDRDFRHSDGGAIGDTDAPMLGRNAVDWLFCRDGKWRPVESGTFPLAHETTARVGRLRAYGNALDLETAAQFCGAVKEICDEIRPVIQYDL